MSQQMRNGYGFDFPVPVGQSMLVSSITGTYTATIVAGPGKGTALATDSTGGGTYGPYSGGVVIRLQAGANSLIDYDIAVSPALTYSGALGAGYNSSGDVASLVDGAGNIWRLNMQAQQYLGSASSQFFTVPDGVTVVEIEACGSGAGGGGGYGGASGGGGGGGGAGQYMLRRPVVVSPGETLTINVPTAGTGGSVGGNGAAGNSVSGSICTVTGSVSGLLVSLASGNGGKAGTATIGGAGGDTSGPIYASGVAAPAAGTAGTGGNDYNTTVSAYGGTGAGGGSGACSTGASISGGRGGRSTTFVANGAGGSTGAVSGNGAGGGGASGFPDSTSPSSASGGNGGNDDTIGGAAVTPGAGGGGGGRNKQGGAGGTGMVRIYY